MIRSTGNAGLDFSQLERTLRSARGAPTQAGGAEAAAETKGSGESFADMLAKGIKEVNQASKDSEQASMDLAAGKNTNIHETMLAATKAELGFNMLVQLRNKAIDAYQEVMRMQV